MCEICAVNPRNEPIAATARLLRVHSCEPGLCVRGLPPAAAESHRRVFVPYLVSCSCVNSLTPASSPWLRRTFARAREKKLLSSTDQHACCTWRAESVEGGYLCCHHSFFLKLTSARSFLSSGVFHADQTRHLPVLRTSALYHRRMKATTMA
jgi:hypothetical protein